MKFRIYALGVSAIELNWMRIQNFFPCMPAWTDGMLPIRSMLLRETCYRFLLPDGTAVPDPASRHQLRDVFGASELIDPRLYQWQDIRGLETGNGSLPSLVRDPS